jgi:hypothetical protein
VLYASGNSAALGGAQICKEKACKASATLWFEIIRIINSMLMINLQSSRTGETCILLRRFLIYEPRTVGTPRQVRAPRQNSPVASFLEKSTKKIRENKEHLVPRPFTLKKFIKQLIEKTRISSKKLIEKL